MRAREFLFEYRRDITMNRFRDRLLSALKKMHSSHVYDDLYHAQWILANSDGAKLNPEKSFRVHAFDQPITVNKDNIAEVAEQITPTLLEKTIDFFESRDPTPNKKYVPWMIQTFVNDPNSVRMEDYNNHDLVGLYDKNKHRIKPEHRDINKFKTYGDFARTIWDYGFQNEEPAESERGDFEEVYEDDKVRVVKPLDEKAACYYGRGTMWCTAATKGDNRFEYYTRGGPLYILLPKNPDYVGEKYQLHFPSDQFMNEQDDPVNLYSLLSRFPDFFQALKNKDPDLRSLLALADPEELKQILDAINEKIMEYADEYVNDMENNDTAGWDEYRAEAAVERGYLVGDPENMEIDWERVHEDDDLNNYTDYNDRAREILRDAKDISKLITPESIPNIVRHYGEDHGINYVDDLPALYKAVMNDEGPKDLADDVYSSFVIRPADKTKPEKTGRTQWIAHTPNYQVGWFA